MVQSQQQNYAEAKPINAMTVDVEDYVHVSAFAHVIKKQDWDQYESRVERNTQRLLNLFDQYHVHATFFVLGWVAQRNPGLVREIAARGHEVASHGLSHQLIYNQSPTVFREETRISKELLEDLVQRPVLGYRAASYSITQKSLWALDILVELGFVYDSSIFPVYHDKYGIPNAKREPHRFSAPGGGTIIEWPLSTAKVFGFPLPVAGGGYFRLLPYWLTRAGLARINRDENQPFIFYLHPWEIDPDQPRINASWLSRFRHYTNLSKCEERLRRLLDEFQVNTVVSGLERQGLLIKETHP